MLGTRRALLFDLIQHAESLPLVSTASTSFFAVAQLVQNTIHVQLQWTLLVLVLARPDRYRSRQTFFTTLPPSLPVTR